MTAPAPLRASRARAGRQARASGEALQDALAAQQSPRAWRFTVLGRPVGKARARVTAHGTYTPQSTRAYARAVGALAKANGVRVGAGPARLHLEVWTPDRRRVDLDNILKAIGDALVEVGCIDDDACTMLTRVSAEWMGVDAARPRVDVCVEMTA